ncbi:MAG: TetR/AcrR family transcriptional regulator [Thermoplasmatota archaeon]
MTDEQETRKRILETAFELFMSKGFLNTSMGDIIGETGISKGGLYHHFDSKYDLARNCLFHWAEKEMGYLLIPGVNDGKTPEQRISDFIDVGLEVMVGNRQIGRFFFELYQAAIEEERDLQIWEDFLEGYVGYVEEIYSRMGAKDPKMLSYVLMSSLDGMALYYVILSRNKTEFDVEALRKQYRKTFIENVK